MNVANLIRVGVTTVAVAAAAASCAYSYRTYRKAKEQTVRMKASNDAFDVEIEAHLREIGGDELVMQYKAEVLRRTGKL